MSNSKKTKNWVVIPAAGVGKRMQADRPKQYLSLMGKTVIEHTLNCFSQRSEIEAIILVLHPDDPYWRELNIQSLSIPIYTVDGGKERSDSVLNGLTYLQNKLKAVANDWVFVHDAARPCLSNTDIDKLFLMISQIKDTSNESGGILATPVRDTMKRSNAKQADRILKTEERNGLWHALTPQVFRVGTLSAALTNALQHNISITDEASAMEVAGYSPLLIEGSPNNLKITRPDDLALAEFFLQQPSKMQPQTYETHPNQNKVRY